jgi:predicted RND superfamily exporter protein
MSSRPTPAPPPLSPTVFVIDDDEDMRSALGNLLRSVGRPILITSVALTAGFMIACLSNFQPVRHFGILASVTMVIGVFTDLFLLPALLVSLRIGEPATAAVQAPVAESGV